MSVSGLSLPPAAGKHALQPVLAAAEQFLEIGRCRTAAAGIARRLAPWAAIAAFPAATAAGLIVPGHPCSLFVRRGIRKNRRHRRFPVGAGYRRLVPPFQRSRELYGRNVRKTIHPPHLVRWTAAVNRKRDPIRARRSQKWSRTLSRSPAGNAWVETCRQMPGSIRGKCVSPSGAA